MAYIHNEKAAPRREAGRGSQKSVGLATTTNDRDTARSVARQALNEITDNLATMADWRDELHAKHRRAMLLWDLGQITVDEWQTLIDEVGQWHQAAEALAVSIKRRAAA